MIFHAEWRQIPETLESLNDDNLLKNLDDKTAAELKEMDRTVGGNQPMEWWKSWFYMDLIINKNDIIDKTLEWRD